MQNSFHPTSHREDADPLALRLKNIAQTILVVVFGLSPLLVVPTPYISLAAGKVLLLLLGMAVALFFYSMAMLRAGSFSFRIPLVVIAIWSVVAAATVAAVMSGDLRDSLLGDNMEGHTVAFILLMALIITTTGILAGSKQALMRLYALLIISALLLSIFHVVRLFLGPESLTLGVLTSATSSLIGSWNGLAIFFGLIVLLALTAVSQLPLARAGRYIIIAISVLSLIMLALINFNTIWYLLGATSLLVLFYQLVLNRWSSSNAAEENTARGDAFSTVGLAIVIALFSVIFIIGGAQFGSNMAERLGISYIEVRPSFMATVDLGKAVLQDDLVFGAGPNRFSDVWRLHKDPTINQTIFWDAQFDTGYNYMFTSIIGSGLVGAIAWILFLAALIWSAIRFFFRASTADNFWYFVGFSSMVASLYLWGMSIVYVPPPAIMILAAITTGVFLVANAKLFSDRTFKLSVTKHRKYGLVLIVFSIMMVSVSGGALYVAANQTLGVYEFNKTLGTTQEGDAIEVLEEGIARAFNYSQNDVFPRQIALYRIMQMRALLSAESPSTEEQQLFQTAVERAITAAGLAINLDPTDPRNHQTLGQVYSILSVVEVEGASDRALESYREAMKFDPLNPTLKFLEADLLLQKGDKEAARQAAEAAVALRSSYSEALYFLAQLDIDEGNTDQAVARVVGIVQLEPQNPARRYQLGILLASLERLDEAIVYLEQAVTLDPQYANARYFLALGYAEKGRTEDAIQQLTIVRDMNETNTVVDELIERLRNGESLSISTQGTVAERQADGEVTAEDLEGGLVTSPNPVSNNSTNESSE